ncbi:eukaryotic aspartyl protease [Cooperia oncophora]
MCYLLLVCRLLSRNLELPQISMIYSDINHWMVYLGLAGQLWLNKKVIPPMQNVLPQLDHQLFTVWMDRKLQPIAGGDGGLITFGDFDTWNCAPTVSYVNLSSLTFWQFPIDGFSIGWYKSKETAQVISDTGTSFIGAPSAAIQAITRQVGANFDLQNQFYTVYCYTMRLLPDLVFTINGMEYRVPSIEYVLDIGLGDGKCVITFFEMESGGFGPAWILGDPWIRSYCQIHDIGQQRIGFAKAIHVGL